MLNVSSLVVLFAFGLVITGCVYLGVVQARFDAKGRQLNHEAVYPDKKK
jgi:hypothetical protein